jgi:hypothetical protein
LFFHAENLTQKKLQASAIFCCNAGLLAVTISYQQGGNTTMTYKAATFNGNVVKGTGATLAEAKANAEAKAAAIGSCIRKRIC